MSDNSKRQIVCKLRPCMWRILLVTPLTNDTWHVSTLRSRGQLRVRVVLAWEYPITSCSGIIYRGFNFNPRLMLIWGTSQFLTILRLSPLNLRNARGEATHLFSQTVKLNSVINQKPGHNPRLARVTDSRAGPQISASELINYYGNQTCRLWWDPLIVSVQPSHWLAAEQIFGSGAGCDDKIKG